MIEDIEETERLLNFVLYPKPAANRCLATTLRSMLPSLEALSPGLALTLVMCSVEYKDMQYVFNESYPPKSDGAASFCAASHSSNTTWGMFARGSQLAFRMSYPAHLTNTWRCRRNTRSAKIASTS